MVACDVPNNQDSMERSTIDGSVEKGIHVAGCRSVSAFLDLAA